jgi:hypothetical protein
MRPPSIAAVLKAAQGFSNIFPAEQNTPPDFDAGDFTRRAPVVDRPTAHRQSPQQFPFVNKRRLVPWRRCGLMQVAFHNCILPRANSTSTAGL